MAAPITKALALILSLALTVSFVSPGVFAFGNVASRFSGGSGSEDDPYLISSAAELDELASRVNGGESFSGLYVLLTEDIDVSAISGGSFTTPVGTESSPFRGNFSGGGHTLSGLGVSAPDDAAPRGLFGRIVGGSVRDLTVSSALVRGGAHTGGVVGSAENAVIENVSFSGEVSGAAGTGGIAGAIEGGIVSDCSFTGSVTGSSGAGGLFGSCASVSVSNCSSDASVEGAEYVGGLFGIAQELEGFGLRSRGTVSAPDQAGGVCGFCFDSYFGDCVNSASVIGTDRRMGGIAGTARGSSFLRCENGGNVYGETFVGGLIGSLCGCSLSYCLNVGAVSGKNYIGGIAGWSDDGAEFGDSGLVNVFFGCMNAGRVTGEWGVGGLIGDSHDAEAEDCFSTGAVTSVEYAGGLAGYAAESAFSRCYSVGTVAAESSAGALAGKVSYLGASFENCFFLEGCCPSGDIYGVSRGAFELLNASAYEGFDFENVWEILPAGYPYARLRSVSPPPPLSGDADGDGRVTVSDALLILRFALGLLSPSPLELFRADADMNGAADVPDALAALRSALGIGG